MRGWAANRWWGQGDEGHSHGDKVGHHVAGTVGDCGLHSARIPRLTAPCPQPGISCMNHVPRQEELSIFSPAVSTRPFVKLCLSYIRCLPLNLWHRTHSSVCEIIGCVTLPRVPPPTARQHATPQPRGKTGNYQDKRSGRLCFSALSLAKPPGLGPTD